MEPQEKEGSRGKEGAGAGWAHRQKITHEHGRGVGRACFPTWEPMAVTGNTERKNMGFGVRDPAGSDADKLRLCPNSPMCHGNDGPVARRSNELLSALVPLM